MRRRVRQFAPFLVILAFFVCLPSAEGASKPPAAGGYSYLPIIGDGTPGDSGDTPVQAQNGGTQTTAPSPPSPSLPIAPSPPGEPTRGPRVSSKEPAPHRENLTNLKRSIPFDKGPSLTREELRNELLTRKSPANPGATSPLLPYADDIYDLGLQYNVDPNAFLAVTWLENHYMQHPRNMALVTNNPCTIGRAPGIWGQVPGALSPDPRHRWGVYPNLRTGIEAFFRLIVAEYYPRNQRDMYTIMWGLGGTPYVTGQHAYGPAFENPPSMVVNLEYWMRRNAGLNIPVQPVEAPPPGWKGDPNAPPTPRAGIEVVSSPTNDAPITGATPTPTATKPAGGSPTPSPTAPKATATKTAGPGNGTGTGTGNGNQPAPPAPPAPPKP